MSRSLRLALLWLSVSALSACGSSGKKSDNQEGSGDSGAPKPMVACQTDADCSDGNACNGVETCQGNFCVEGKQTSCDDGVACTRDLCDPVDAKCTHRPPDADGDGAPDAKCVDGNGTALGTDCDDNDPKRFPGNVEVCALGDGSATRDEDCDPKTFGKLDQDRDGFISTQCSNDEGNGKKNAGDDCADTIPNVHPTAVEVCDLVDNDCNGIEDDGLRQKGFFDGDGDGYGRTLTEVKNLPADQQPEFVMTYRNGFGVVVDPATGGIEACPDNVYFSRLTEDCNDAQGSADALYVHENAIELCDGIDNNCNGKIDENVVQVLWYPDVDGDGFGDKSPDPRLVISSCARQPGYSLFNTDCNDLDPDINPRAPEQCDGIDNDCNGKLDYLIAPGNYEDDDADGVADALCGTRRPDCDDNNPTVYPGAPELCDGVDNDCNGVADTQTRTVPWFVDADKDGFGDPKQKPVVSCEIIPDRVMRAADCNDADPRVNPDAKDDCSGKPDVDDNCNGKVDEDATANAYFLDNDKDGYGTGTPLFACGAPVGYATIGGDCNDASNKVSPGTAEICDPDQNIDDDCDGAVDCLDTDCTNTAVCDALVRLRIKDPAEPLISVLAKPFTVTIEALKPNNQPVAGLDLTLTCDDASAGVWASPVSNQPTHALTDANGLASFTFTPGQAVDKFSCTVRAGDAIPKIVQVQTIAPPDGTIFTAVNVARSTNPPTAGSAVASSIYYPSDIAIASDGTAYISSYYGYYVARVSPRGALDVFAGSGQYGFDGDGGPAKQAKLTYTRRLALDETRNRLYIGEQQRVRLVDLANGKIFTYAGGSGSETTYNGGSALAAQLDVAGLEVASDGTLYILDTSHGLLKVSLAGTISYAVASNTTCPSTGVSFYGCYSSSYCDVARGKGDAMFMVGYVCVNNNTRFGFVRYDPATNNVSFLPGAASGQGTTGDGQSISLTDIGVTAALARDNVGNLYIAQQHRVRRIDQSSRVFSPVLGSATAGTAGDFGPYADASVNDPRALAIDPRGGLWIAEQTGSAVRRIWRGPAITSSKLDLKLNDGDNQSVYPFQSLSPITVSLTVDGAVANGVDLRMSQDDPSFYAPSFTTNYSGVGIVTPQSGYLIKSHAGTVSALDLDGQVAANVAFGYSVVKPPAGTITSIVNPTHTPSTSTNDGQSGGQAPLYYPTAVASGSDGTVFLADYNGRVWRLATSGLLTWLAGGGNTDDAKFGAVDAKTQNIGTIQALTYYDAGKQLFASTGQRVYRIDLASQTISVIMGLGTDVVASGSSALSVKLSSAYSAVVDGNGLLYVADQGGLWSVDTTNASPVANIHHTIVLDCSNKPAGTLYGYYNTIGLGLGSDGKLYIAASECPNGAYALNRIDGVEQHTRITQLNGSTFVGPIAASSAQMANVRGNMESDTAGNLYWMENSTYRMRRLTPGGQIELVAGNGTSGGSGDFGPAKSAQINPYYSGVAVVNGTDVVMADYYNQSVRRVWSP